MVSSGAEDASFQTDFGRFTIHRSHQCVIVSESRQNRMILLSDIERLEYGMVDQWAVIEELIMGGLDGKNDAVVWHQIVLVLKGGGLVPLYTIGQYEIRLPQDMLFMDFASKVMEIYMKVLGFLEIYRDAGKTSTRVLKTVQSLFEDAGKSLPTHAAARPR